MWRNEKPLRKQPHVLAWPQDLLSEVFSSRGESRFALLSPCLSTLLVISSCICDNAKVGQRHSMDLLKDSCGPCATDLGLQLRAGPRPDHLS